MLGLLGLREDTGSFAYAWISWIKEVRIVWLKSSWVPVVVFSNLVG